VKRELTVLIETRTNCSIVFPVKSKAMCFGWKTECLPVELQLSIKSSDVLLQVVCQALVQVGDALVAADL